MLRKLGIVMVLACVALGCADDDNHQNNNTTNQNDGGLEPEPTLLSVSPTSGPQAGGTTVTLTGTDFQDGLSVTFNGQDATAIQWISSTQVSCITPPATLPGAVNVRVTNPDLQYSELFQGFEYLEEVLPPEVTWCDLRGPASLQTDPDQPTPPIFGRVFVEGLTDRVGMAAGLTAEIGWGPDGSDPQTSTAWQWHAAVYSGDSSQLYDEYVASLTADASGSHDYAYRFSGDGGLTWLYCDLDDSDNGYDPTAAGTLDVTGAGGPLTLGSVDLPRGSVLGGAVVTLSGTGFVSGAAVIFGATASPQVTYVSGSELTVTVPAGPLGPVDVTVENPGGASDTLSAGFEYLLVDTPTVDGDLADWDPALRVASNTVVSDWSAANELTALYVAFDDTHLYVGIDGTVESNNVIVAYLDTDFGASTGITDTVTITDNDGELDSALGGSAGFSLAINVTGFGADFAFGSKGMNDALGTLVSPAGLRGLTPPENLSWLVSTVDAGNHALECALPLADLLTTIPATGATLALVVKITEATGEHRANQTLPEDAASDTISQAFSFTIFPAGSF